MTGDGSGLKLVERAFAAGGFGKSIGQTLGLSGTEAASGQVTLSGSPSEDHYNPLGTVQGDYLATMLDGAMALAVQTVLPAGTPYSTTDLHVTYLRPLTAKSGPVSATGQVVHVSGSLASASARLVGPNEELYAHAVATFAIRRDRAAPSTSNPDNG